MKKSSLIFLEKIELNKLKCRLLQFLFGALRANIGDSANSAAPANL